MKNHMEAAIKAAAEAIHAAGWTCEAHEPQGLEKCDQCAISTSELARKTLAAAISHITAQIDTQAQKLLAEVRAAQERFTEATAALRQAEAHRRAALRSTMAAGIPRDQKEHTP